MQCTPTRGVGPTTAAPEAAIMEGLLQYYLLIKP